MLFTLIRKTYPVEDIILRVLKDLTHEELKIKEDNEYLIIFHNYNDKEAIKSSLDTLSNDMMFPLYAYTPIAVVPLAEVA